MSREGLEVYLSPKKKEEIERHLSKTVDGLRARFPGAILGQAQFRGEVTVEVNGKHILEIAEYMRDEPDLSFRHLADITCVDYMNYPASADTDTARGRFAVIYHFYSFQYGSRIRLKCFLPEAGPRIDSLTPLWQTANWLEREVFDMFGVIFDNHPDLRRILMPEDSVHFPLRKDYPLTGAGERESFPYVTRDGRTIEKPRSPRAR